MKAVRSEGDTSRLRRIVSSPSHKWIPSTTAGSNFHPQEVHKLQKALTMEEELIMGETSTCSFSSSSKAATFYKYDVFLSFRGLDTRNQFTSHLYNRLKSIGFRVYLDEKEMDKGKEINKDLKRALVNSRICMPIFSKNYASSTSCLFELSQMVQYEKKIIPIFYDVTPDDVKLKTPLYKEYLEDYRHNLKCGLHEVEKWEKALLLVAEKSGYNLLDKNEAEEITKITHALIIRLMPKHQDVTDKLVDIVNEVKCVEELLDLDSCGFRIVGIFGMGGIGKTTLAKVIFNQLICRFPNCCSFLENVRENLLSKKLLELQRQMYKDMIDPFSADCICSHNEGKEMIRKGLENKKVLLILDDMNDANQLTDLLGHHLCFTSQSRLIITTRDRNVLEVLNQKYKNVLAYNLKEMDGDRALKLFSRCAFMEDFPSKEFQNLAKEVVSYTRGLPLALEVFGSLLFGSGKDAWKRILEELKKFPDKSISDKLIISYQELKPNQQNIFLDIACYYGNLDKEYACYMWEDCGWCPEPVIKTLKDRSLVKIIGSTGSECFWMHDMLKEAGRASIQVEGGKSGKMPNRLRIDTSIDILHETEEKAHVETLVIHAPTTTITREDMVGLHNLRFLELYVDKVQGDFSGLFPNLRWFWCPRAREFKPINFNPKKLLILELSVSNIAPNLEGWNTMKANKLKILDLSMHDLPRNSKDQLINAHNNHGWSHLNLKWILNAKNLEKLNLRVAYPVAGLEEVGKLLWLRQLHLFNVRFRYLSYLPSGLLHLTLHGCEFLHGILDVSNLTRLESLEISSPKKLNGMQGLGGLYSLEVLVLAGLDDIKSTREVALTGGRCFNLEWFPYRPLKRLKTFDSRNLQSMPQRPKGLNMKDILTPGYLKNLKRLEISRCNSLIELPDLSSLKKLSSLSLWQCENMVRIMSFNGLESLTSLFIWDCPSLKILPDLSTLRKLRSLKLQRYDKLRCILGMTNLELLENVQITFCKSLELSPLDFNKLENVKSVFIKYCCNLPYIRKGTIPPFVIK